MVKIEGVAIPDSKMASEVTELVRDTASALLFNHSSRVYCFGALAAQRLGLDRGIGIKPEMLPSVFGQFMGSGHSSVQIRGGLEIGLTLVKQIVEAHGTVEAHSAGPGCGSLFVVRLPAQFTNSGNTP